MASRAYGDAAKEQRRQVILETAATLFETMGGGLPSVAQIAEAAGLGKGTIYLYYRTKEEIFAAQLLEAWSPALAILGEEMARTERSLGAQLDAFVTRFVRYVDAHPSLLRLDGLCKEVLERNMTVAALGAHKIAFLDRINQASSGLEASLSLPAGRGFQLLTRCHALTRGLWQSFGDPVGDCDALGSPHPVFATELREALLEYWRGALGPALA